MFIFIMLILLIPCILLMGSSCVNFFTDTLIPIAVLVIVVIVVLKVIFYLLKKK